jgi:hypothetical protein
MAEHCYAEFMLSVTMLSVTNKPLMVRVINYAEYHNYAECSGAFET